MVEYAPNSTVGQGCGPYGLQNDTLQPYSITSISGAENSCHFKITDGVYGKNFIIQEAFHALYGGNNWHNGDGAGPHTFMARTNPWGICTQLAGAGISNVVSGYDRQHFDWKGWKDLNKTIVKDYNTSAIGALTLQEVSTGNIQPSGTEQIYILRDFVNFGDALHIKLPNINWQQDGDVKNQYLWIENHQMQSYFDRGTRDIGYYHCNQPLSSGIYAQIQVGKDQKVGTVGELFYSGRNAFASFLFPLTQDGCFDFKINPTLNQLNSTNCSGGAGWEVGAGNYIPYSKNHPDTKANPLTGFSDLFSIIDDPQIPGLTWGEASIGYLTTDYATGLNEYTYKRFGDNTVAFNCFGNCGTGRKILGMATNPTPFPVYTLQQGKTGSLTLTGESAESYENRKIQLNGLGITILEENFEPQNFGNGAVKIKVKWDDYNIDQNARYCGDIELLPHMFNQLLPSMVILSGNTLEIDRGKSATRRASPSDFYPDPYSPAEKLFTDTTILTLKSNSKIEMQAASNLIIENGSTLKLNNAAEINMLANAHIEVKSNGILDLEAGSLVKLAENATILVHDGGKIIIRDGATLMLQKNSQLLIEQDGTPWGQGELVIENTQTDFGLILGDVNDGPNNTECRINGKLTLKNGANFTYKGSGFYTFGEYFNTNFEDPTSKVNLVGLSQNNPLIKIECAEIDFRNHDVNIEKGLLSYQNTGLMQIENSNFYLDRLTLEGNGDAQVFNAFKPKNFVMNSCIGNNFNFIGKIANAQPSAYLTVGSCTFEDCKSGFLVESCGYFNFANLTMKKTVSNCIELNNTGKVICINCKLIDNTINTTGITANDVTGFYMHSGKITDCKNAIIGTNALVWLRNCATIENNLVGVELYGSQVGNPVHYSSMLTIGDLRSANVRSNITAIKGSDFLLNIEPVSYDVTGTLIYKSPNNFTDNTEVFDICYTAPKLFNEVNARFNYWGTDLSGTPVNLDPAAYDLKEKTYCGNASNYHFPIDIITVPYSTCLPDNCSNNCTFLPSGGGSSSSTKRLFEAETYEEARSLIESEFLFANKQFLEIDTPSTRELFYYLSLMDLTKSEVTGNWVDADENEYDEKLVERVNTAKVLAQGLDQNNRRQQLNFKKKPRSKDLAKNIAKGNSLSVFPNPAQNYLNVNYQTSKNELLSLEIINSLSQVVIKSTFKCESGNNNQQINIEILPAGIYTIKLESNSCNIVKQFIKN